MKYCLLRGRRAQSSELLVPAGEFVRGHRLVSGIFVEVRGVRRALNLRQDRRSQAPSLQPVPVESLETTKCTISLSLSPSLSLKEI